MDGRRGSPLKAVISVEAECKIMNIIEGETLATHRALSVQYTRKDFFPIQTSRAAHDEMYSVDGRKKKGSSSDDTDVTSVTAAENEMRCIRRQGIG